jgi:predicted component of type VI protein secretion system
MELYKICPACKEKNPVSEVICRICMTNLSSIRPTSEPQGEETPANEDSTVKAPEVMTLARASDGRALPVQSGFVLGRGGEAEDYFQDLMTVSRRHARVTYSDGAWKIEDLGSTNGTWVNGQRIERGKPHAIKKGDVVSLSMACEMRVIS